MENGLAAYDLRNWTLTVKMMEETEENRFNGRCSMVFRFVPQRGRGCKPLVIAELLISIVYVPLKAYDSGSTTL